LKCLQKEPTRRCATAAALADDLRRFQAGESVVAHRLPEAETEIRTPLALRERLAARFTGSPTYTHQLAQTHQNLAGVLSNRGRPEDALDHPG
jgi:hypothetical protein